MQSYIKTANRMVRVTEEEQSVQDKPVLHAKAISNGIRDIGNPSLMRKVYLRNRSRTHHHYTHISNANFIALMRSHAGLPVRVTERVDRQATASDLRCRADGCADRAKNRDDHALGCRQLARQWTKRHDSLRDLILECAVTGAGQGEGMVLATEKEPRYRHTGVKADGLLYRMGGDDVYFDITVVYGVGQLDRDHPQDLKDYLAQTPEPIQVALGRAVAAKGRHYEQANKREWKRLHPEQDFVAHGGTDAGVELRVSDLVPLVFDSTGTPHRDTAKWLKQVIPAENWCKFESTASHIFANYYGSLLRSGPVKWVASRNALRNRGGRSFCARARAHGNVDAADGDVTGPAELAVGERSGAAGVPPERQASASGTCVDASGAGGPPLSLER